MRRSLGMGIYRHRLLKTQGGVGKNDTSNRCIDHPMNKTKTFSLPVKENYNFASFFHNLGIHLLRGSD